MFFNEDDLTRMQINLATITQYHQLITELKLIGHRGMGPSSNETALDVLKKLPPENTVESFKEAIILGADGIEFDVFSAKDGAVVAIHSDELWRHVYGIARDGFCLPPGETKHTYIVSQKTVQELQQLSVGPNGEKIPILQEVLSLVIEANQIRSKLQLPNLIINLEFKDSKTAATIINTVENTFKIINQYISDNHVLDISFKDLYFCSFNHDALKHLINIADGKPIQIAPIIGSATLFGPENVNEKYIVNKTTVNKYDVDGLKYLRDLLIEHNLEFIAYDFILWDISLPLIEIVMSRDKQLHCSSSDYRNYDIPGSFGVFLLKVSTKVPLCFKADAIDRAREVLINKAELLNKYRTKRQKLERQSGSQSLDLLSRDSSGSSGILLRCLSRPKIYSSGS